MDRDCIQIRFVISGREKNEQDAHLSSMVLKNIGAILAPMHTPPVRLFGTFGMSSPMYHRTLFVADFRDEPVPTTSPTYASGCPLRFKSSICARASVMPSRGFFSIASAWRGMSGRLQASGAGDKSSVFVSPDTLKTVMVIFFWTSGRDVNHSAFAHDSITFVNRSRAWRDEIGKLFHVRTCGLNSAREGWVALSRWVAWWCE